MSVALILLVGYDMLRRRKEAKEQTKIDDGDNSNYDIILLGLKICIALTIVAGMIDLVLRKRRTKKGRFSWIKVFFGVREKFVMKERFV